MNSHYGSDFDDFLRQEGILEACEATAEERVKVLRDLPETRLCACCGKTIERMGIYCEADGKQNYGYIRYIYRCKCGCVYRPIPLDG